MMIGTVRVGGMLMRYSVFGKGETPFIILCGVTLKSIFASAAAIESGFSTFGEKYRVYTFARRDDLPDGYSVAEMAEDTAAAMTVLGLQNAILYGASQGGMMALHIAAKHPELVRKIISVSAPAKFGKSSQEKMRRLITTAESGDIDTLKEDFAKILLGKKTYRILSRLFVAGMKDASPEEARRFIIMMKACLDYNATDILPHIHCPVLVSGSEGDQLIPIADMRALADALHAERLFYPAEDGFGHAVYDETGDFREKMLAFCLGNKVSAE